MKKILASLVVAAVVFLPSFAFAQVNPTVGAAYAAGYGDYFTYEAVTIDNTAGGVSLTAATYTANARTAFCTLEGAEIRYRIDSGAPTTSVGHLLEPFQAIVLVDRQIAKFKAIRTGATSGSLKCSYGK